MTIYLYFYIHYKEQIMTKITQCRDHNKPRRVTPPKVVKPIPTTSRLPDVPTKLKRTGKIKITKKLDVLASKKLTLKQLLS